MLIREEVPSSGKVWVDGQDVVRMRRSHVPRILIADEPTGNLDPVTSWEIIKLLVRVNELGTTLVMATHNAEIVNALRRRVVHLDHGAVVRDEREGLYAA